MADVLKVQPKARFKVTRNGTVLYDQDFAPGEATYTEHAGARVILATNMGAFQEFDMEGVATGEYFMLETDRPLLVALNSTAQVWQVGTGTTGGALMLSGASITHIYVQNESTTNVATAHLIVTD